MKYRSPILVFFFLSILILTSCRNNSNEVQKERNTYDRIIENNKIKVGYISYPPSFIKDPNSGELSGIMYEVLEKIGEKLQIEMDYVEEVGWGSMIWMSRVN